NKVHKLKVVHPKYIDWLSDQEIEPGETALCTVVLKPALAQLLIKMSDISEKDVLEATEVYISDIGGETFCGKVRANGELVIPEKEPGKYKIRVSNAHDGYQDLEKEVNLTVGNNVLSVLLEKLPSSTQYDDYFSSGLTFWKAPKDWRIESHTITQGFK